MFRWIPYAMVRIAAFFIAGVLLGIYQPGILSLDFAQTALFLFVGLYFLVYWVLSKRKRTLILGILGLLSISLAGYIHLSLFVDWDQPDHLSTYSGEIKYYQA
ncbi:MAG: hypothetical protein RIF39_12840, partial [Cyclobacteriaceae bacterium]